MSRVRLSVISPDEQLSGAGPTPFERLARSVSPGTAEHRGIVTIALTLAARAVNTCVPPSIQATLSEHVLTGRKWVRLDASEREVEKSRATCFGSVAAFEQATVSAVQKAREHVRRSHTALPLDAHADHVVERYVGLSAHFTVSAVCHSLDAVRDPALALSVIQDVEGARAYQACGLGSARHAPFRQAAWEQASWEGERHGLSKNELAGLSLQVFHEYLGGRWRAHADRERAQMEEFILWALGSTQAATNRPS